MPHLISSSVLIIWCTNRSVVTSLFTVSFANWGRIIVWTWPFKWLLWAPPSTLAIFAYPKRAHSLKHLFKYTQYYCNLSILSTWRRKGNVCYAGLKILKGDLQLCVQSRSSPWMYLLQCSWFQSLCMCTCHTHPKEGHKKFQGEVWSQIFCGRPRGIDIFYFLQPHKIHAKLYNLMLFIKFLENLQNFSTIMNTRPEKNFMVFLSSPKCSTS